MRLESYISASVVHFIHDGVTWKSLAAKPGDFGLRFAKEGSVELSSLEASTLACCSIAGMHTEEAHVINIDGVPSCSRLLVEQPHGGYSWSNMLQEMVFKSVWTDGEADQIGSLFGVNRPEVIDPSSGACDYHTHGAELMCSACFPHAK